MVLNEWFVGSLMFLGVWLFIWFFKPSLRKKMFWVSLFTAPLGITQILFLSSYWRPTSLFNLAQIIGVDIESIIFSFAIGGIASVGYEVFFRAKQYPMDVSERRHKKHLFHPLAFALPIIVLLLFYFFSDTHPIYAGITAMFVGAGAIILFRPDLNKKVFVGGLIFLEIYFVIFLVLNLLYPNFVVSTWNFSLISGILVGGIPVEELLFALSFGMMWSGIYEYSLWYKLKKT